MTVLMVMLPCLRSPDEAASWGATRDHEAALPLPPLSPTRQRLHHLTEGRTHARALQRATPHSRPHPHCDVTPPQAPTPHPTKSAHDRRALPSALGRSNFCSACDKCPSRVAFRGLTRRTASPGVGSGVCPRLKAPTTGPGDKLRRLLQGLRYDGHRSCVSCRRGGALRRHTPLPLTQRSPTVHVVAARGRSDAGRTYEAFACPPGAPMDHGRSPAASGGACVATLCRRTDASSSRGRPHGCGPLPCVTGQPRKKQPIEQSPQHVPTGDAGRQSNECSRRRAGVACTWGRGTVTVDAPSRTPLPLHARPAAHAHRPSGPASRPGAPEVTRLPPAGPGPPQGHLRRGRRSRLMVAPSPTPGPLQPADGCPFYAGIEGEVAILGLPSPLYAAPQTFRRACLRLQVS